MNWDVALSSKDAAKLRVLAVAANTQARLRVVIEGGGCSGFRYRFAFDEETLPDDIERVFPTEEHADPVVLATDPISLLYLQGAQLDYAETLTGAEFQMKNPGARSTCGCRQSFSA